ncbi:MAG: choice-of-anchor D domain-containing protein [Ignavibacteria bacterium]|nr:choice-of-anchor D domain-containing protein [Ignavibacteria bacterium]MBK6761188.1 choice-of-anchor D domain-containing protein [Ignavibacteria bacterium]MBK7185754.1 choice-of-anchor D domain-containing protein [Ignavibacteria bacterium]
MMRLRISAVLLALLAVCGVCPVSAQEMVVSEYYNIQFVEAEWSEFLVVQDNFNAVGYMISDANTDQTVRQGGPQFRDVPLWRNLRAGTIIVLWHRALPATATIDTNAADGYLELSSIDQRFFNTLLFPGGVDGMNMADAGDLVHIMRPDTSNVHMLGHDKPTGPIYDNATGPKVNFDSGAVGAGRSNRVTGRTLAAYSMGITKDSAVAGFNDSRGLPNRWDLARTFQGVPNINHWFWRETREPQWSASPSVTLISRTAQKHVIEWTALIDANQQDSTTGYVILRDTLNFASFPANAIRDGQMIAKGARFGTSVVLDVRPTILGNRFTDSVNLLCGQSYTYRVYGYRYKQDDQLVVTDDTTARGRQYTELKWAQSPVVTKPNPAKPVIQASRLQFCSGDTVTLTTTAVAERYDWTLNGTPLAIGGTTRVVVREPGTYRLTVTEDGGCSSTSDPITLTALPAQDVDISPRGTQTICATDSLVITAQTDAPVYEWFRDGTVIIGATGKSLTVRGAGDYFVRIATSQGCPAVSSVVKVRVPDVRYRFTPSSLDFGSLGQCTSDTTLSLELVNDGATAITVTSASFPPGYALESPAPGFVVAPGGKQTVRVLFAPSAAGITAGTVTFNAVPCNITASFTVRGERTQVSAALDRTGVDFGVYSACPTTIIRPDSSFWITNSGTSPITVKVPSVLPPFYLLTSFPLGVVVQPGGRLEVKIQYRPLGADRDRGVVQQISFPFTSATCRDTLRAQLQAACYAPSFVIDPDTMDVGVVLSCANYIDTVVTVFNPTAVPVTVNGVIGTGFTFTGSATVIEPNTGKSVSLRVQPAAVNGPFTLDGEITGSPCDLKAPVRAEGLVVAPTYSSSSSSISFGSIEFCGPTAPLSRRGYVVATGLSGLRSTVKTVSIASPYSVDVLPGTTFTDTLYFNVTFTPTAVGTFNGRLSMTVGPCNTPIDIDLTATTTRSSRTTTITGNSFGTVGPGQSNTQTIRITNTGSNPITVEPLTGVTAPFTINSEVPTLPTQLSPDSSVVIEIMYEFAGHDRRDTIEIVSTTSGACADTTRFEVRGATTSPGVITGVVVSAPSVIGTAGTTVDVPLTLESAQSLLSANITQMIVNISYDPRLLKAIGIEQGAGGAQGSIIESVPGKARITINSTTPIEATAPLVVVRAKTYVSSTNSTPFSIDSVSAAGAQITGRKGTVTVVADCDIKAELTALGTPAALRVYGMGAGTVSVGITALTNDPCIVGLYDVTGRHLMTPLSTVLEPGSYRLEIDVSSVPCGAALVVFRNGLQVRSEVVYLCR